MHSASVSAPLKTGVTTLTKGSDGRINLSRRSFCPLALHDVGKRLAIDPARVDHQRRVPGDQSVVDGRVVGHDHDGVLRGEQLRRQRHARASGGMPGRDRVRGAFATCGSW